jgi:chemotaxis protein CheY-P-specific phosphatase CheC
MCSLKLSELVGPEATDVLRGAIADVAEQSFFMAADPCADDRLRDLASESDAWLAATVRFEEAGCAGVVSCLLPDTLARALFDAFNGRDPLDAPPASDEVFDLVGEFANMVCGAWLTRTVNGPAFVLSPPVVQASARDAALDASASARVVVSLNDLPLVVVARA